MGKRLVRTVLILLSIVFNLSIARAATYDWIGAVSANTNTLGNWYNENIGAVALLLPGSGDVVQIGVNSTYTILGFSNTITLTSTNMPVVNATTTWGSLIFGYLGTAQTSYTYGKLENLSLSVNTGIILTVNGNITQNHNSTVLSGNSFNYNITTISGAGTLKCLGNFNVGNTLGPSSSDVATVSQVSIQITQLTISGNIVLTSTGASPGGQCYPYFSLEKGTTTLVGKITFAVTGTPGVGQYDTLNPGQTLYQGYGLFTVDRASGVGSPAASGIGACTLELQNVTPITLADNFYVYFELGGSNGTVLYDDPTGTDNQKIYTANEPSVTTTKSYVNTTLPSGYTTTSSANYYNLTFSGASTKAVDANSTITGSPTQGLTVGNVWTTSTTGLVSLSANNPTVTVTGNWINSTTVNQDSKNIAVSGNWVNSGGVTQGSGNITLSGSLTNSAGVTQSGSGNITITGSVINNSGGTLTLGTGNLSIGANYTNAVGGVYTQSTGTTFFTGAGAQSLVDNSTTGTTFKNVTFNGGGTATMGSGTNNVNFSVANTGVLTMLNSSKLVAGTTVTAGGASYLTLISDINGTAAVAAIPAGCQISGNVNVQRYLSGGNTKDGTGRWTYRGYRLLSSPVSTVAPASYTTATAIYPYTLAYLANSGIVTGAIGGYNSGTNTFGSATAVGNPTLYLYRENITPNNTSFIGGNFKGVNDITGASLTGTTDATKTTASVSVGNGFLFFFRGDRINNLTGSPSKTSAPYVAVEPVTFTSTGYLNQGTYTVQHWYNAAAGSPLLYTTVTIPSPGNAAAKGYNLVGNPYASSIDWETFATTGTTGIVGTNMGAAIWVFNPITNQYNTYVKGNGGIGTGDNMSLATPTGNTKANLIASGQGFFIRANAASPTLTFYETAKAPTQQAALPASGFSMLAASASQNSSNQLQYMRLVMVKDSINNSDILFFFDPTATTKFSGQEDGEYLSGNGAPESLASMSSDSIKLAVNRLPLPKKNETRTINLVANATASGQYTFLRNDLKNVPALYNIWLMDNFKKDSLDIKHNSTYIFNIDKTDTNTFGSKRFQIVIRQDPALGLHLLDFTAAKVTGGALIGWKTENEDNYTNFTVERSTDNGSTFTALGSLVSNNLGTYSFTDPKPPVTADQYRLKLTDLDGDITYSKVVTLMYAPLSNAKQISISIYPNPATSILNLAINLPNILQSPPPVQQSLTVNAGASSNQTQSYDIKIIDITGATISDAKSSQPTWQTNISTLLPGTYIIRVLNNKDNTLVGKTTFVKL